jgi:lauroyl/myristoyl acyltransferase
MVIEENPLKDVYRRLVWGPWRELLERLPAGWEYRANRRLGLCVAAVARNKVAQVAANMDRALGADPQRPALARETMGTHFLNQYASFAFGKVKVDNWDAYLRFEGIEQLEAHARSGRGAVLIHPHMGPAQLPLCVLGVRGFRVHQIGGGEPAVEKSETGRWATGLRHDLEGRMPVVLHQGGGYLRSLLRALRQGDVVLTAGDGTGGGKEIGRRYPRAVLGHTMGVPVGGFYLAARSGAAVHALHTVRDPQRPGRWLSVIGPEVDFPRDDLDQALEFGADWTAAFLSRILRSHPGEWHFWDGFQPGGLIE